MEKEFKREQDSLQEEIGHLEDRAQKNVVQPSLLLFKGLVDVVGQERKSFHQRIWRLGETSVGRQMLINEHWAPFRDGQGQAGQGARGGIISRPFLALA